MSARRFLQAVLAGLAALAIALPAAAQPNVQQTIRYGEILSMEEAMVKTAVTGAGAAVGATVGSVAGYALSNGRNRWLGGLLGGALGGVAGGAVERGASKKKGWQLIIKIEGTGQEIGVQVVAKKKKKKEHQVGNRVRLLTGPGGQTEVTTVD